MQWLIAACVSSGIAEGGCANAIPTVGTVTDQIGFQHSPFQSTLPRSGGAAQNCFVAFGRLQVLICWLAKRRWIGADIALAAASIKPPDSTFGRLRITHLLSIWHNRLSSLPCGAARLSQFYQSF